MLEMDGHLPVMNIEDRREVVEPKEKLEDIPLDDQHPDQATHVSTQMNALTR